MMVTIEYSSFLSGIGPHSLLYPSHLRHYPPLFRLGRRGFLSPLLGRRERGWPCLACGISRLRNDDLTGSPRIGERLLFLPTEPGQDPCTNRVSQHDGGCLTEQTRSAGDTENVQGGPHHQISNELAAHGRLVMRLAWCNKHILIVRPLDDLLTLSFELLKERLEPGCCFRRKI